MKVMKFGGTSVKDAEAIRRVENIVKSQAGGVLVVVSALAGVTNDLVKIIAHLEVKKFEDAKDIAMALEARHLKLSNDLGIVMSCDTYIKQEASFLLQIIESVDILGEITPKTKDLILSRGELLSSRIIYQYLKSRGYSIGYSDPRISMRTMIQHGECDVDWSASQKTMSKLVAPMFLDHAFVITGGYVGMNEQGDTTTLGRGGSDYSAAVFASLLRAERLEIWTDVDGIMTSDPRMIPSAQLVSDVTYAEASELAYFGAKVLHPKTIFPSVEQNIPVYVMNTFKPEITGTRIVAKLDMGNSIKAIAFRKGITIINIQSNRMLGAFGFLSKVFEVFNHHETSVDLVSTSEVSISVTIDNLERVDLISRDLEKISNVTIFKEKAIVSIIGEGMREECGIAAKFFTALEGINISLVTMGASEINLSIVVDEKDLHTAVERLHLVFFETGK